jgi:ABC-type Fe3+-hydroxamate transport system substrate-binding protein
VVTVTDDLGASLDVAGPARRVVSLVPSLTESIAATEPGALIAATQWCTHPAGLEVERIRGTKNPDVKRIIELHPDLVVANREENRRRDVETLRAAGVPVWVTVTESVPQALGALERMFGVALRRPQPDWLAGCIRLWTGGVPTPTHRVAIPVWRDPWMVVGATTFTGDLAARIGLANVFADAPARYPRVEVDEIAERGPNVVLLPDEPYPFSDDDGPEALPGLRCALVSGRALTWYGPSLLTARESVLAAVRAAESPRCGTARPPRP